MSAVPEISDLRQQCLRSLWSTLHVLCRTEESMDGSAELDGRIYRLARTIAVIEVGVGVDDITLRLSALRDFVEHGFRTLPVKEADVVAKAITTYMNKLKREATEGKKA